MFAAYLSRFAKDEVQEIVLEPISSGLSNPNLNRDMKPITVKQYTSWFDKNHQESVKKFLEDVEEFKRNQ